MSTRVTITGLDSFRRSLGNFSDILDRELGIAVEDATELVTIQAKNNHRFNSRSGNLERSIKAELRDLDSFAFVDDSQAVYGKWIHDGFRTWAPDEFMTDALERKKQEILRLINNAVNRAVRRV